MSAVSGGEEEWTEKLVACGTDGAAVMTGSKTGVDRLGLKSLDVEILLKKGFIFDYIPGPMLRKVLDSNTYQGVNLRHMMANKDKLLDKLSDSMDNRFGDAGSGILSNTNIVSFQQWPDPENSADFNF
ncbi:unnamed protein product [Leuciscus chuanchicus]